jgi:predicted MFS family arabinose efflux permease
VTLLFAVVGYLLRDDWQRQKAAAAQAMAPAEPAAPALPFRTQALAIVAGPWSRVVLLIAFAEGAAGFGALAMWATHLHRSLHLQLSSAGAIVALFGLGGMGYMFVARRLIPRLGSYGLAAGGGCVMGLGALVVAFSPWWPLAIPASLMAGFGFFMFHNTLQANAANMAPRARGTGVALFSAALFLGQSVGAVLAASLIGWVGSTMMVALGAVAMVALGVWLGHMLHQREAQRNTV